MNLVLQRDDANAERTHGHLLVNGAWAAFTLEDAVRQGPKIPGLTAIPAGVYRVAITFSQRFQRMLPLLLDVPGFEGIRIHAGNTNKDTSGCLLVGLGRAHDSILSSQIALGQLQPQIAGAIARGETVTIDVRNPIAA